MWWIAAPGRGSKNGGNAGVFRVGVPGCDNGPCQTQGRHTCRPGNFIVTVTLPGGVYAAPTTSDASHRKR